MPRLTLNQINVVGSPEAEHQVQVVQGQLVRLEVNMQNERQQFRREAEAFCEGRAHERKIYQEAFVVAERFYENKAYQCAEQCNAFLREEMEQFSKKHEQEREVFQRLREHEVQKAREAEMHANAAVNHEASVSQERYLAQQEVQHLRKEAYQLKRQQEAVVAEAQQATDELVVYRRRHRQFEDNVAKDMQQGATEMTEQIDAIWRQEHQMEMSRWEQECRQLRLESQSTHVHLRDREQQDKERELRYQEQAIVLQSETARLVQEQQAMMSEQQTARLAGLRAREMETHAQVQIAELDQREVCMQL
jgi:hypothetical protein